MSTLCITDADLQRALREITGHRSVRQFFDFALYPNHVSSCSSFDAEWIARAPMNEARYQAAGRLRLWAFQDTTALPPPELGRMLDEASGTLRIGLGIGVGAAKGNALCHTASPVMKADDTVKTIRIIGPGMARIDLSGPKQPASAQIPLHWLTAQGLYSRVVGTIGMATFARLQRSSIAIVGAGSMGSIVASGLTQLMGREGRLVLVDPDRVERANLPNWMVSGSAHPAKLIGRFKVEALAEYLRTFSDPPQIEAFAVSAFDWNAQCALRRSEILISCVDNPTARYAVAFLAALYLRPHLDVGTGVFLPEHQPPQWIIADKMNGIKKETEYDHEKTGIEDFCLPPPLLTQGTRRCGADVRLIWPTLTGQTGNCLFCRGGLGDLDQIQRELAVPLAQRHQSRNSAPFWNERAGSLWTLNNEAASMAQRKLLTFLSGEMNESCHLQMDELAAGIPRWRTIAHTAPVVCQLCRRVGLADTAWKERQQIIQEIVLPTNM